MAFDVSLRDGGSGAFDVSLSTPASGGGIAPAVMYYRKRREDRMRYLKQSTAVDLAIGPFVDATDAVTAETALTITQPDIRLKKNGGAWGQKNAAQTLSHEENGWYEVALDATDTGTLGVLSLAVHEAGALPVWHDFMVLPANVYDSLVGGSDTLDVQVTGIGASVITATSIAADAITDAKVASDVTIASVTGAVGSVTGAVGSVTGAVGSVTGNVGGNVVGSVGSVTAGVTLADDAITSAKIDATAVTEIQSGLATAAALATVDDFLDTEIAAILADTNELQSDWVNGGRLDLLIDAIKAKTDALPAAPAATGDIPSAATIADAVWDEDATAHQTQGTFGQAIGDPAADTDTIWGLVNTNLNATVSSRASQTSLDTLDDFVDTEVAAILADTNELQLDLTNGGRLDLLIDAIKAKTDALPTDPADQSAVEAAITAATAPLATAAALTVVDDFLDTEIAAIKAKTDNLPAAPAATGDIPTAQAIATEVWSEPVPGAFTNGTAGEVLGSLLSDLGAATVEIVSPVLSGGDTIEIVAGDSYLTADGRSIVWTLVNPPNLTGATVTFHLPNFSKVATVSGGVTVTLELTDDETASIGRGQFTYSLIAEFNNGSIQSLLLGAVLIA